MSMVSIVVRCCPGLARGLRQRRGRTPPLADRAVNVRGVEYGPERPVRLGLAAVEGGNAVVRRPCYGRGRGVRTGVGASVWLPEVLAPCLHDFARRVSKSDR